MREHRAWASQGAGPATGPQSPDQTAQGIHPGRTTTAAGADRPTLPPRKAMPDRPATWKPPPAGLGAADRPP
eukprot:14870480-Alexandrium_andersonii.AAC.1